MIYNDVSTVKKHHI